MFRVRLVLIGVSSIHAGVFHQGPAQNSETRNFLAKPHATLRIDESLVYIPVLHIPCGVYGAAYLRVLNVDVFQLVGVRAPKGLEPCPFFCVVCSFCSSFVKNSWIYAVNGGVRIWRCGCTIIAILAYVCDVRSHSPSSV